MSEPRRARSLAELRGLTDAELTEQHDLMAAGTEIGLNYYLAEITRRRQDRHERLMIRLTWTITALTAASLTAVVVSLAQ